MRRATNPLVTASGQFGAACYEAVEPPANQQGLGYTFDEANAACAADGGALVSIHSDVENDWIYGGWCANSLTKLKR